MYAIIKEHEDFLLINKAPGTDFHKGGGAEGLPGLLKKELGTEELYTVHRLDKATSGLLLFARGREAAADISKQFRSGEVEKYYLALSDRKPRKKQGMIQGDMAKARRGGWKLLRTKHNPAVTQFFSCSAGKGLRLFLLRPRTGKTHQLRVALKSIGSPVLGDPVYHENDPEIDRTYLHSYAIIFRIRGKELCFVQEPGTGSLFRDEEVRTALKKFERPWELDWPVIRKKRTG